MGLILTIVNIPIQDWCAAITETRRVIGRSSTAQIPVPARFECVSRQHACVWTTPHDSWARDLSSKCGTWLNGIPLLPNNDYRIVAGDTLRLGDLTLECATGGVPHDLTDLDAADSLDRDNTLTVGMPAVPNPPEFNIGQLSHAESQVLHWLRRGFVADADIARKLHRSPHTVRSQMASIFIKLGVDSREELLRALWAFLDRQNDNPSAL